MSIIVQLMIVLFLLHCCNRYLDRGLIVYVDLGEGYYRLGGTALSSVYNQAGRPFQPKDQLQQQRDESGSVSELDAAGNNYVPTLVCIICLHIVLCGGSCTVCHE